MLFDYLETNIQNELRILAVFQVQNRVSIRFLKEELDLSPPTIHALIEKMNVELQDAVAIERSDSSYLWKNHDHFDLPRLVHRICKDSMILHCLKFLILNHDHVPFSKFTDDEFLTKSSSYRIRHTCELYLRDIGLYLKNNQVSGPEYRVRFLIGLLYSRYGISCYEMDDTSQAVIQAFVLASNQAVDHTYLDHCSSDYDYFACLLAMTWKRIDISIQPIQSAQFDKLKELHIYQYLQQLTHEILEKQLHITIDPCSLDYIYLVYCCTNNCLFADKWTQAEQEKLHQIIFTEGSFADLKQRFIQRFGKAISSHAFEEMMITFYKKCLLELQCIIPDENCYVYSKHNNINQTLYHSILDIMTDWTVCAKKKYMIRTEHIFYITIQTAFILEQSMPPITVYVCADRPSELEVMSLCLKRKFSQDRIHIVSLLINTSDKDVLLKKRDSIIICEHKFKNILNEWHIGQVNDVILVSTELNNVQLHEIYEAVKVHENARFMKFLQTTPKK